MLLDRATGQSWRWPSDRLRLAAASREHLLFLFEERSRSGDDPSTARFTIVNRAMEAVGDFSIDAIDVERWGYYDAVFSPDGQTIALDALGTVYLVPVESAQPAVLIGADATARRTSAWLSQLGDGPGIRVGARYENESGDGRSVWHYFSWEGAPLPGPACQGPISPRDLRHRARISPDGRYVAWLVGGHIEEKHVGVEIREDPWPSVVIADGDYLCPALPRAIGVHVRARLERRLVVDQRGVRGRRPRRRLPDRASPSHPVPGPSPRSGGGSRESRGRGRCFPPLHRR